MVCLPCTRRTKLDFNSAISLELQCKYTHVPPLGHIILIPSQPVFGLYSLTLCAYINFTVYGLSRSWIYRTWYEQAIHYTTVAVLLAITTHLVSLEYVGKQKIHYLFHNIYLFKFVFKYLHIRICDVMVSVLSSSVVDRVFEPRSCQTKDYEIGICCFSSKSACLSADCCFSELALHKSN
jgi:hypothetical protein